MKHYSIRNICIDYDGITNEQYISKSRLKKVVYIPPFCGYADVLYELGEDLGLYCYE